MRMVISLWFAVLFGMHSLAADILSPRQFSQQYIQAAKAKMPDLKLEMVSDLQLHVKDSANKEWEVYLDNAYTAYKANPQDMNAIVDRYLASLSEIRTADESTDRSRIVPIVKDRRWIKDIIASTKSRGMKELPNWLSEPLNDELEVFYAIDSPQNISYIGPDDLKKHRLKREELRALAVQNLLALLPKISIEGSPSLYMIVADGNYEASLLLVDSIWTGGQIKVDGDIVAAIPSRDLLLVTGSKNKEGLAKMRMMADKLSKEASYSLTNKLFVYRNGKFEIFD